MTVYAIVEVLAWAFIIGNAVVSMIALWSGR